MQRELPVRKQIRLKDYDYSNSGYYFVTICVQDKHELLGKIDVGANYVRPHLSTLPVRPHLSTFPVRPHLSEYGSIVEKEITVLSKTYDTVEIIKHVVMPNHIHMIIKIDNDGQAADSGLIVDGNGRTINGNGRTQFAPTVSRIIKQFKGSITKQIGFSLWQKSFHDHIIRDESDYMEIWNYIDKNPEKWTEDCYFIKK